MFDVGCVVGSLAAAADEDDSHIMSHYHVISAVCPRVYRGLFLTFGRVRQNAVDTRRVKYMAEDL